MDFLRAEHRRTGIMPSTREIQDHFGFASQTAAVSHLKALEKKIEEFQICLKKRQLDMLPEINTEFHDLLYALSKSPRLIHMINALRDQIFRFRQMILKDDKLASISNEDHIRMLNFMRKRDAEGVERLVRDHILRGQDEILREFGKKGAGK